jgi:hypothetical protein
LRAATVALATPAGLVVRALPGLAGVGLLAGGAWMVYHPAGLITAGALVLADTVATGRGNRRGGEG